MYHRLGQLVAMSVVMGGSGLHTLSQSVFSYLSRTPVSTIIVDISEVPDVEVKQMLENVYFCI